MQAHDSWEKHVAKKRADGQKGDGLLPDDCCTFLQGAVRRARDAQEPGQSLLDAAVSPADRVAVALAISLQFQETWFAGNDELEIDGYKWIGRNRTKVDPDAPRNSGGSGVLVHESISHLVSIIKKPTYGGTEGVIWIKVEHGRSNRFDVFCSLYLEQ